MTFDDMSEYGYKNHEHSHTHSYLLPTVVSEINRHLRGGRRRCFDLGCGNGSTAAYFAKQQGIEVAGVDVSSEGIQQANAAHPELRLEIGSAYDDLAAKFGSFPVVISLEVVEHLYAPRKFAATLFSLVEPGGIAIVSTPYHSYVKNLVMAVTGKFDTHFTALWDHGHIKFWSMATLATLLTEAGFSSIRFHRVGRVPVLAKSLVAVATRAS